MRRSFQEDLNMGMNSYNNAMSKSTNPEATRKIMIGVVFVVMLMFLAPVFISLFAGSNKGTDGRYVKEDAFVAVTERTMENGEFVNIMYVNYFGGDQFFEKKRLDSYVANAKVGDNITVYYDSQNPGKVYADMPKEESEGVDKFKLVAVVTELVFAIPVIILGIFVAKKMMGGDNKNLMDTGIRLDATIENIVMQSPNPNTGIPRYKFYCVYQDPSNGRIHRFMSKSIESVVDPNVNNPIGSYIPVYVQPNNFKKYYVYVSSSSNMMGNSMMTGNSMMGNGMMTGSSMMGNDVLSNNETNDNNFIDYSR